MKYLPSIIAALLLLVATTEALADKSANLYVPYGQVISGNLGAASNSFSIGLEGTARSDVYGLMDVYIKLTDADNSTTALNMSCTSSHDRGTTNYTLQDCVGAAGVYTCKDLSWTKDPSAIASPKQAIFRVDIEGLSQITCTFTDTGGAAADLLVVNVGLAVKG